MARTACALHILVKTEAQALDIMKQLAAGANFQQLAKKYSTCPSKKRGGDLGEFKKVTWLRRSIKQCFQLNCCSQSGLSEPALVTTSLKCYIARSDYRPAEY